MDKVLSTLVLVSASVMLAIASAIYYSGLMDVFKVYEQLTFDSAYVTLKNGKTEISIRFRNTGARALTVVALEINREKLEPNGVNPFPITFPTGTEATLRLQADLDTFRSGVTYEVAIITASGGRYVKTLTIP